MCLFNGFVCVFRLFIKILKFVYFNIRLMGYICMGYIDDFFLLGYDYIVCQRNVQDMVDIFYNLGFVIYLVKLVFIFI